MVDLKKELQLSDLIPKLPAQKREAGLGGSDEAAADAAGDRRPQDRGGGR